MDLFTLSAVLTLDTQDFENSLRNARTLANATGQDLDNALAGNTAASTRSTARGVVIGQAAYNTVVKLAHFAWESSKDIINTSAEVKAETSQYASTMGDLAASANQTFGQISKDTNILDTRLKRIGLSGFAQFRAAGMDSTQALESMSDFTQLAADAAAYYDTSLEDVAERIRSFIRGNTEAGESIGLFTSMADRERRATETYGLAWKDLTEAQRQFLLLDTAKSIYQQTGATGQAARESHEWANTIGNLNEAWTQAKALIGNPLMEKLIPVLERVTQWLTNNPEKMEALGNVLGDLAGMTFDGLISIFDYIAENGPQLMEFLQGLAATDFSNWSWLFGEKKNIEYSAPIGPPAPEQTFSPAEMKQAADAWTNALTSGIESDISKAWSDLTDKLGGQEFASEFGKAYQEYVQSNALDYGVEVPAEWFEGTAEKLQGDLDAMHLSTTVSVRPAWSGFSGFLGSIGSHLMEAFSPHATGLNYVPYDNYPALLHKGETVLTRTQAENFRSGASAQPVSIDYDRLAAAVASAMGGMSVQMDGHAVGVMVAPTVSAEMGRQSKSRRYTG